MWFWPKKASKISQNRGGDAAFREPRAISRPGLQGEFAVREFWRSLHSLAALPNPDPILRAEGKSISVYRTMIDGHLGGVLRKRRAAVRARPWTIESNGADETLTRRVREIFERLDIRSATTNILKAPPMGCSYLECMWSWGDDWIVPTSLLDRPQEWFGWHADGTLRYLDDAGLGRIPPDYKILAARHDPEFSNPYGYPLLSECFWPVALKRGGLQFWMTFLEKYGMPHAVGKVPTTADDIEREQLASSLAAMVQDAVAVINDTSTIELHEATGKAGSTDAYHTLVKWADTEISKAILGETLSTELQDGGSKAAAQTHNDVRADLALDDASLVEQQYNQLIDWICEINAPTASRRPRYQIHMPEDLKAARVERDMKLGIAFTPEYYQDVYGIDPRYIAGTKSAAPAATPPVSGTAEFAESIDAWTPDRLAQELAAQLQPDEARKHQVELVGAIMSFAERADGFEAFTEWLETEYPRLELSEFRAAVERFCLIGDLAGRSDAVPDQGNG